MPSGYSDQRSETLSYKQMAVKFQAANKTQMALEFFWNYLGILRNPIRIMTGKVKTLSQKQTALEFLKNSKAIYLVFPVGIVQKFWEEEFLEQMALAKDR